MNPSENTHTKAGAPPPVLAESHAAAERLAVWFLFILLGLTLLYLIALDLLPPTSRDAMIHHLALPKLWLQEGRLVCLPWALYSYYPQNLAVLYMIPLSLGLDVGAKFIHLGFGLASALIVYYYLRSRTSKAWGLVGAFLFLSTPMVMRLAASAYVDLGLTFFISASALALIKWDDTGRWSWLVASGLALGLGLGFKYNAFIAIPLLTLGVIFFASRRGESWPKILLMSGVFLGLAGLIFAPWAVRNFLETGNPIYPQYNSLFGVADYYAGRIKISQFLMRSELHGETIWQFLLIPLRFFFEGRDYSPQYFDGVLNAGLIILCLPALIKPPNRHVRPMAAFALTWLCFVAYSVPRIRYAVPVLPLIAVIAAFGLREVWLFLSGRFSLRAAAACTTVIMLLITAFNLNWAAGFWHDQSPWLYLTGRETRQEYLFRTQIYYPAVDFINRNTPADALVLYIIGGNRSYYLDRRYRHSDYFSYEILRQALDNSETGEDLYHEFRKMGATHILSREKGLRQYLDNQPKAKQQIWLDFYRDHIRRIFQARGYVVFKLR